MIDQRTEAEQIPNPAAVSSLESLRDEILEIAERLDSDPAMMALARRMRTWVAKLNANLPAR